jgi:hypothetical protein
LPKKQNTKNDLPEHQRPAQGAADAEHPGNALIV